MNEEVLSTTPLWRYVTKKDKVKGGGNWNFVCNHCQVPYSGSYSRVKAHLLKIPGSGIRICPKVREHKLQEMKQLSDEAEARAKASKFKSVPLPTCGSGSGSSFASNSSSLVEDPRKKKRGVESPIEKLYNAARREEMDSIIARLFYAAGLPFHLARCPYYKVAFNLATSDSKSIQGYIPPGYNKLRTTLLRKEREHVEKELEPIKSTWKEKGVSIVTDGWTDEQRRPLMNFMAVSEAGAMFIKAVNTQGSVKDKEYISKLIIETITEVGHQNVVQVITDNAPVCKSAGLLVEGHFKHIFWTPCVVHTLNLALKNICHPRDIRTNVLVYEGCAWISEIIAEVVLIRNFITKHSMRLAMFNEHVELKLFTLAETRFASSIIMLQRFKDVKQGLRNLVICNQWSSYKDDDPNQALFIKEKLLDDDWWNTLQYVIDFTKPIIEMLRLCDTDEPCLHLVYERWDRMIDEVKSIIHRHEGLQEYDISPFHMVVDGILTDRWSKSSTPLHSLAHSLNPRYYSRQWLDERPGRVPPHRDLLIAGQRLKCFERYYDADELREVNIEYAKFSSCREEFANANTINDRWSMNPYVWWVTYGVYAPLLQQKALMLLGQPCSYSCSERNWSTYSFINSVKRNKITPQRGEDLVFVHTNLRLLSRRSPEYLLGDTRMWDIGGDSFDTMEGTVGVLEVADLSLNEPEMERMILDDNEANVEDLYPLV
ncbi:uncharacterized protein LOC113340676 [Papaver somniferum]|uniref:uncharacterized protein LOC113340676 n=1 Tax=Papaver somniferum TaxID=3469 RepID=UPI000E70442A|nr:uncharacterized protein LOC113340676 [Papaver somniferum]